MKGMWIAGMLLGLLTSCERKEEQAGGDPSPDSVAQGVAPAGQGVAPGETGESKPGKTGERPVLVKKKPPVAEPVEGQPGFVKSPYNGKIIDVKGIPTGSLVADPTYPAEEKKYFRVPEMPETKVEPPKILDPTILIDPGPLPTEPPAENP